MQRCVKCSENRVVKKAIRNHKRKQLDEKIVGGAMEEDLKKKQLA